MRVGDQRRAPAALPPVKTRYQSYRRLGGAQGRPGRVRKISPPTGNPDHKESILIALKVGNRSPSDTASYPKIIESETKKPLLKSRDLQTNDSNKKQSYWY